ncbi:MAG: T9SS type A sorting domain-containing protein [Bacteroidia bacterium]
MKNFYLLCVWVFLPYILSAQCDSLFVDDAKPTFSAVCANEHLDVDLTKYIYRTGGTWSSTNSDFQNGKIKGYLKESSTFYYTYTDKLTNCTATDSIIIKSKEVPDLNMQKPADVCWNSPDFPLTFNATPYGGTWFDTVDATNFIEKGRFYPIRTTKDDGGKPWKYDLFYTYTDPITKCSDTSSIPIIVKQLPIVKLKYDVITFSIRDTFIFLDTLIEKPKIGSGTFSGTGVVYKKDTGYFFNVHQTNLDSTKNYSIWYTHIWKSGTQPHCGNADTVAIKLTTGITTDIAQHKTEVAIYPNPSTGAVSIQNNIPFKLEIYNPQGQLVLNNNSELTQHQITLPAGTYWLRVKDVKHTKTQKIVVY